MRQTGIREQRKQPFHSYRRACPLDSAWKVQVRKRFEKIWAVAAVEDEGGNMKLKEDEGMEGVEEGAGGWLRVDSSRAAARVRVVR